MPNSSPTFLLDPKILSKEKITLFYKDIILNSTMEELALIRKELRAIAININQITMNVIVIIWKRHWKSFR